MLLSYEHEIRSHAYNLVCNTGVSLKAALRTSWNDEIVKGRYFITPLALQPAKRQYESAPGPQQPWPKVQRQEPSKGKGRSVKTQKYGDKGKGKGKSKSKGKGYCKAETPDGKRICFGFNGAGCSDAKSCRHAHVCGVCLKSNVPMSKCDHN